MNTWDEIAVRLATGIYIWLAVIIFLGIVGKALLNRWLRKNGHIK